MAEKPLAQALKMLVEAISVVENNHSRAVYLSVMAVRMVVFHLHAIVGESTFKLRGEDVIFLTRLLKNFDECVTIRETAASFNGGGTKNPALTLSGILAQYADFILDMLLVQYDSSTRKMSRVETLSQSFKLAKCFIKGAGIIIERDSAKAKGDLEAFKTELMNTYRDYVRICQP